MDSFFLLIESHLIGAHVLAFFGISLPVVEVSGGLIVIAAGWAMLEQPDESERSEVNRNVQPQDPFPPSILSVDTVPDGGSRVDFGGDHVGCERSAPPPTRNQFAGDFGCAGRIGAAWAQYFSVLRLCGPACSDLRTDRNDRHHTPVGDSVGLHRRPDRSGMGCALLAPVPASIR
jgi:hypothetical protein